MESRYLSVHLNGLKFLIWFFNRISFTFSKNLISYLTIFTHYLDIIHLKGMKSMQQILTKDSRGDLPISANTRVNSLNWASWRSRRNVISAKLFVSSAFSIAIFSCFLASLLVCLRMQKVAIIFFNIRVFKAFLFWTYLEIRLGSNQYHVLRGYMVLEDSIRRCVRLNKCIWQTYSIKGIWQTWKNWQLLQRLYIQPFRESIRCLILPPIGHTLINPWLKFYSQAGVRSLWRELNQETVIFW